MRKVFVLENGGAQKKLSFEIDDDVKTLGQLIPTIEQYGVSTADKAFYESKSRTQLMGAEATLPTNEADDGKLIIMVTNAQKKISNGILDGAKRPEINAYIRENGLASEINEFFGKSWTNIPSVDLVAFINSKVAPKKAEADGVFENAVAYVQDCEDDAVRIYLLELLGANDAEEKKGNDDELEGMDVNNLFDWVK